MVANPFCFRSQGRISLSMTLVNSANVPGLNLTATWRANMSTSSGHRGEKEQISRRTEHAALGRFAQAYNTSTVITRFGTVRAEA